MPELGMISISEMAKIHGISRQTLIYYDKISLFKPEIIHENGYRYYSLKQVPVLREICFLRNLDISIEDIKEQLEIRDPETATNFFLEILEQTEEKIQALQQTSQNIKNRLGVYQPYAEYQMEQNEPVIRYFTQRKVVFIPWAPNTRREELHYILMRAWRSVTSQGYQAASGWGSIFRKKGLLSGDLSHDVGSYVALPADSSPVDSDNVLVLPAGNYVTVFKYGMPYYVEPLRHLLSWIKDNGYTPCGDAVDACILDTTFYTDKVKQDFCQLQVPISLDDK